MRSWLFLAALALAADAAEEWCASSTEIAGAEKMHRGTYNSFSLYVAAPGLLEGCYPFHKHVSGNDGLWLLQFATNEKFDEMKRKLAGMQNVVKVILEDRQAVITGGGDALPAALGVDACGGEKGMDVIPLPRSAVKKASKTLSQDFFKRGEQPHNPAIQAAVDAMAPERIIAVIHLLSQYNTRNSYSDELVQAATWLERMYTTYNFTVERMSFRGDMAPNVVATKLGKTHPEKVIVVGAHLDSRATDVNSKTQRAPGADDNASGCSALLAIAEIIFERNLEFDYTIKFCAFSGEEQGLLGSAALAKTWSDADMDIVAMFNADMLGWSLPNKPITLGFKDSSVNIELTEEIRALVPQYVTGLNTEYSHSCCSDYLSFYNEGFAAVGFFENDATASAYPHYHTSTDLQMYLDSVQLHLHTQALAATVLTYAGMASTSRNASVQ
ncbi:Bacterial leucyl aminopeptidase [Diplonema papillatum]|nr:Bacterial leucyl aminopeptidase [Diplonema papillatum]|eukprot:gene2970-4666_t